MHGFRQPHQVDHAVDVIVPVVVVQIVFVADEQDLGGRYAGNADPVLPVHGRVDGLLSVQKGQGLRVVHEGVHDIPVTGQRRLNLLFHRMQVDLQLLHQLFHIPVDELQ